MEVSCCHEVLAHILSRHLHQDLTRDRLQTPTKYPINDLSNLVTMKLSQYQAQIAVKDVKPTRLTLTIAMNNTKGHLRIMPLAGTRLPRYVRPSLYQDLVWSHLLHAHKYHAMIIDTTLAMVRNERQGLCIRETEGKRARQLLASCSSDLRHAHASRCEYMICTDFMGEMLVYRVNNLLDRIHGAVQD